MGVRLSRFVLYVASVALAALATGVQIVVLPWLAVGELQLPANQVGWVQSAVLLPGLLLMLMGGALADRAHTSGVLPWLYVLMTACHGAMLWVLSEGALQLMLLLFYALLLGVINAFLQPLRDKLLPDVMEEHSSLQSSVVKVSLGIYVAQAVGVSLAGQIEWLGLEAVMAVQVLVLSLCVVLLVAMYRLRPLPSLVDQEEVRERSAINIRKGLLFVRNHPVLKHLMILVGFNGFMHIGVFVVALPLLSRDVFQQDAFAFAGLQLAFVAGNVVAALALLRRGPVAQPGRAVLFSLLYAGIIMLAISAKPTETGLFILVFAWGVVAGVSASLGKALLQQQVTDNFRGRVLSIYQLALFGGAPLGALVCGYAVQYQGALKLFEVGGEATLVLFIVYLGIRALWNISPVSESGPQSPR